MPPGLLIHFFLLGILPAAGEAQTPVCTQGAPGLAGETDVQTHTGWPLEAVATESLRGEVTMTQKQSPLR